LNVTYSGIPYDYSKTEHLINKPAEDNMGNMFVNVYLHIQNPPRTEDDTLESQYSILTALVL